METRRGAARGSPRAGLWLAAGCAILLLVGGCGGEKSHSLRGVITDVQAQSILEWESIRVRPATGGELTFKRGPEVDLRFWRASHLREHMLTGTAVTVTYKRVGNELVATNLAD